MIHPATQDVLRCVAKALEDAVIPALKGAPEASTVQTIVHLLRHVRLRIDREGQMLFDEERKLRPLLHDLSEYFSKPGTPAAADEEVGRLRRALAAQAEDGRYPSLHDTAARVAALRERVYISLKILQSMRSQCRSDPAYAGIRTKVRDYVRWQLQSEGELIQDSFAGFGARR